MTKLRIKNQRYSELKQKYVGDSYEVECELVKENAKTVVVWVPKWGKQMTVGKDKIIQ